MKGSSVDIATEIRVWSRVLDYWPELRHLPAWSPAFPLIRSSAKLALGLPTSSDPIAKTTTEATSAPALLLTEALDVGPVPDGSVRGK